MIRYLTLNPKLPAGVDLLALVRMLPRTDEASFMDAFELLTNERFRDFLQEKTTQDPATGHSPWTHKRLRQARDSVSAHLDILFTYQKYPELGMPNTTNWLDEAYGRGREWRSVSIPASLMHGRSNSCCRCFLHADSITNVH